jgi:hypothetical protein
MAAMTDFPVPVSSPNPGRWTRTLVEDWAWTFRMQGTDYRIFLPKGVEYEPSIPTPAEGVIPADRLEPASLPHDVIYKLQGDLSRPDYDVLAAWCQGKRQRRPQVTRRFADDLFWLILEQMGVAPWRRWIAYRAVRWFGQWAWEEEDAFELPKRPVSR